MELGNAFTEINDSEEQAARFAMQADEGAGGNVEAEPGDPDYVEALSYGMPPTGGLGMGIDRLAMLLLGKDSIRDVILFPALRERASMTLPTGRPSRHVGWLRNGSRRPIIRSERARSASEATRQ